MIPGPGGKAPEIWRILTNKRCGVFFIDVQTYLIKLGWGGGGELDTRSAFEKK